MLCVKLHQFLVLVSVFWIQTLSRTDLSLGSQVSADSFGHGRASGRVSSFDFKHPFPRHQAHSEPLFGFLCCLIKLFTLPEVRDAVF